MAKEILKDHGGLFQRFEYIEDPYDAADKLLSQQRSEAKEKQLEGDFIPALARKCLKYEYPFLGVNEVSIYSFLSQNDPYEATRDEKLRSLWIDECKRLFGPFKPAGTDKPLSKVTKSQLRDIVEVLKRLLLSDWNDVNFVIGSKYCHEINILSESKRLHRG